MIKSKFRDHCRSRTDAGMRNESLSKILCNNICCLIHSIFELGIEARFWDEAELVEPEPELVAVGAEDETEAWAWV
jgi:hypothetical protein